MSETTVQVRDLSVRYRDGTLAISEMSLAVRSGELVVVIGPSGCGKTTLLETLLGLLHERDAEIHGEISVNEVNPIRGPRDLYRAGVGYVAQRDSLIPWRTVQENVELAMEIRGIPGGRPMASDLIGQAGLEGFANSYPRQLSEGMRKRVAVLRTLAWQPKLLLLDEPFSSLDVHTRAILHRLLINSKEETHSTIILVSHDLSEAVTLGTRIILLSHRPAKVHSVFSISEPHPRDPFSFPGSTGFSRWHSEIWQAFSAEIGEGGLSQ